MRKKIRNLPRRCQALDTNGRQCPKFTENTFKYHGESELYRWHDEGAVTWVRVFLCKKHEIKGFGDSFPYPEEQDEVSFIPSQQAENHDKNGHKIDEKGELAFDPECRGCDAPRTEIRSGYHLESDAGWKEEFMNMPFPDSSMSIGENGKRIDSMADFISDLLLKARAECREEELKDNQKKGETWRRGYQEGIEAERKRIMKKHFNA